MKQKFNNHEEYFDEINDMLNTDGDYWDLWNRKFIIGNRFLGVWTEKNPSDAWRYQQILFKHRPDLILETGSFKGGSALYLATICDLIKHGKVISVDNRDNGQNEIVHPRVEFRIGNCLEQEYDLKDQKVMVIMDCDHTEEHVEKELKKYSKYVTSGQYFIIEDTVVHGAINAIRLFMNKNSDFIKDDAPLFTSNYEGYYIRK